MGCMMQATLALLALLLAPARGSGEQIQQIAVGGSIGGELFFSFWKAAAKAFEAETGVHVTFPHAFSETATTDLEKAKAMVHLSAGTVDILNIDGIYQWEMAELLQPIRLSDLRPETRAAFTEEAFAHFSLEGEETQALPFSDGFGVLYYRSDLLERYGFAAPGPEGWTWDEVEHIARVVQAGEQARRTQWGRRDPHFHGFVWQGNGYEGLTCVALEVLAAEGGGNFVRDDGTLAVDDPAMERALTRMLNWISPENKTEHPISPLQVVGFTEDDVTHSFCIDAAAMFARSWDGMLGECNDQGMAGRFGVTRMPRAVARGRGTWGGWGLGIARASTKKDLALQFIEFVLSHKYQMMKFFMTETIGFRRDISSNASLCAGERPRTCRACLYKLLNDSFVRAPGLADVDDVILHAGSPLCPPVHEMATLCDMNYTDGYTVERPARVLGRSYGAASAVFFRAVHDVLVLSLRPARPGLPQAGSLGARLRDAACEMVAAARDSRTLLRLPLGVACDDGVGHAKPGRCHLQVAGYCVPTALYVSLLPVVLLILFLVHTYLLQAHRMADAGWVIPFDELQFDSPTEILGQGTFGMVLKAEWKGTQVAVRRVMPPGGFPTFPGFGESLSQPRRRRHRSTSSSTARSLGAASDLDLEAGLAQPPEQVAYSLSAASRGLPAKDSKRRHTQGSRRSGETVRSSPAQLRLDFIEEMRLLAKLRHPCILTLMGAVISTRQEPMLVMELMHHGSLHDLLRNETVEFDGELMLPILCDISQGLRFLHAMEPEIVHGDLTSKNVLVDKKFRAKVSGFGLSQKRKAGVLPAPFWTAPELLLQPNQGSAAGDVFAFGVLLLEVYSRDQPLDVSAGSETFLSPAGQALTKTLEAPPGCSPAMATLMRDCWRADPDLRPPVKEIDRRLHSMDVGDAESGEPMTARRRPDRQTTYDLLCDVFPSHVAEALRAGRPVEPEAKDCVTIFFSDIVGFTEISSQLPPRKVSAMLDRLYSKFDALSREHRVFKMETIGDAYMAVSNLVEDQPDHTLRVVAFARQAIEAANETLIDEDDIGRGCVSIRVGFHTGPVVANVVGTRNLRYCLFGDTVNTASRMESNSLANRIHCSEAAARLLLQQAPMTSVQSRGAISIKGKGKMNTFWVAQTDEECTNSFKSSL